MSEPGRREQNMVDRVLQVLIDLYLTALIVGMPLYYSDGYRHIGSDKSEFLRVCNLAALCTIVPVLLLCAVVREARNAHASRNVSISDSARVNHSTDASEPNVGKNRLARTLSSLTITDIFALIYAAAVVLSYAFSNYREEAFLGASGWYMGLFTQLSLVAIFFLTSRAWRIEKWIPALFLPVSGVVALLGVLNRFGVNPLKMEPVRAEFISTIGNINWFCGYLVPVFFMVAAYYLFGGSSTSPVRNKWAERGRRISSVRNKWAERERSTSPVRNKWVERGRNAFPAGIIIYLFIASASLLTQGSASGLFALAVMLIVFFAVSCGEAAGMKRLTVLVFTIFGAGTLVALLRRVFPGSFTYEDTITDFLTKGPFSIIMTLASILALCFLWEFESRRKFPREAMLSLRRIVLITAGAGSAVFVFLLIVHTTRPEVLPFLDRYAVFTFSPEWGSHRGITWSAGVGCFLEQSPLHKLFGAGPDCMAAYLYNDASEGLLGAVKAVYSGRLVNAHNEWITLLATEGIAGAAAYIGMIVTGILRLVRAGKESPAAAACGMGLLAYTINNMFSFQTAINTTAAFLLLGMGEAFLRAANNRKVED